MNHIAHLLKEEKYKSTDVTSAPYKIVLRAKPTSKGPNLIECAGKTSRYPTNFKTYEMPATVSGILDATNVCFQLLQEMRGLRDWENSHISCR